MKVLLVNGSPHQHGCTYTALCEAAKALNAEGIETEFFWLGTKPIAGCMGCRQCFSSGQCVFDDCVNQFVEKAAEADGFIFGSPVHFAGASGAVTSFMDRVFYSGSSKGVFHHKPAAAICSARRGGTTATYDQLNKYFGIAEMPIVSSQYWNMVHGNTPEEVLQDEEGLQTMRVLGRNMSWLLRCMEAGKQAGVQLPVREEIKCRTNFIR